MTVEHIKVHPCLMPPQVMMRIAVKTSQTAAAIQSGAFGVSAFLSLYGQNAVLK